MLPFHRRLAELGLSAISKFGFVLAGGYAISANGMGGNVYPLDASGFEDERIRPIFADFQVTDAAASESSSVQLGLDFRAFPCDARCRPGARPP